MITSKATVTIGLDEWLQILHLGARTNDEALKAAVERALLSARSVTLSAVLNQEA